MLSVRGVTHRPWHQMHDPGLGRLLLSLFPTDPEVFGLLALMLLQQSRAPARFDANGQIVLLDEQDRGERQGV